MASTNAGVHCLAGYAKYFIAVLVFGQIAACQTPSSPGTAVPRGQAVAQEPATLLEYAKFLRDEEKSHREYLEKLYTTTAAVLGVLIAVGIGLIGFLQFKTKKEVREEVSARFEATVEQELRRTLREHKDKLAEMERRLDALKPRLDDVETKVDVMGSEPGADPSSIQIQPPEAIPSSTPPVLSAQEIAVLQETGESKFSFRTLIGIAQGAAKRNAAQGITVDAVRRHLESLTDRGYIGKTLGKRGGERWFVTEAGRRVLLPNS